MTKTLVLLLGTLLLAPVAAARAEGVSARLDPQLVASLAPGAAPVPVLVEFVDKGEQGNGDRIARLARAERELTAASRARRLRRGVWPLVDEADLPVAPEYLQAIRALGLEPVHVSRWLNACTVRASGPVLARLAATGGVARVRPEPLAAPRTLRPVAEAVRADAVPPGASARHAGAIAYGMTATQLARLGAPALHDAGWNGAGLLVALFDEGFNHRGDHTATKGIDVGNRTRDFVRGVDSVEDTTGDAIFFQHGQWTLSTIGGNAPGIYVGPAYGAAFALARTEDSRSETPIEMIHWVNAAEWADSLGVDLISSSLGYRRFDAPDPSIAYAQLDGHTTIITRAVEIAAAKGILVVSSMGNDGALGTGSIDAPADACGDSMLAVGAVDSTGELAGFSSRGPTADGRVKPDVVAQGVAVLVASASGNPDTYVRLSGTSFSCPLVAGVAACLLQAYPNLPIPVIVRTLKLTAGNATHPNNGVGWGQVDAAAALRFDTLAVAVPSSALRFRMAGANPARLEDAAAWFEFALPRSAVGGTHGAVRVYDATGRLVHTIFKGWIAAGEIVQADWDGTDAHGERARAGLYFVSFEAGGQRTTLRLAALR